MNFLIHVQHAELEYVDSKSPDEEKYVDSKSSAAYDSIASKYLD
jgi:hypothetical protein